MFVGLLMIRRGILLNQECYNSLDHRRDTYRITGFSSFAESDTAKKVSEELKKDACLYHNLLDHLLKKAEEEIPAG